MRRSVVMGRTIYEDARLTASTGAITLRGYWLPFGLARTVRIDELVGVSQVARDEGVTRRWPRWGRRRTAWFPLDWSRPRRNVAVALWRADGRCTVVTPANPGRLVALLDELGVPAGIPDD